MIPSGQHDFNIAVENQQRHGLDGSSSDSDADQNPFTKTKINTMQQRNLIPPIRTESDGDTESIPGNLQKIVSQYTLVSVTQNTRSSFNVLFHSVMIYVHYK